MLACVCMPSNVTHKACMRTCASECVESGAARRSSRMLAADAGAPHDDLWWERSRSIVDVLMAGNVDLERHQWLGFVRRRETRARNTNHLMTIRIRSRAPYSMHSIYFVRGDGPAASCRCNDEYPNAHTHFFACANTFRCVCVSVQPFEIPNCEPCQIG